MSLLPGDRPYSMSCAIPPTWMCLESQKVGFAFTLVSLVSKCALDGAFRSYLKPGLSGWANRIRCARPLPSRKPGEGPPLAPRRTRTRPRRGMGQTPPPPEEKKHKTTTTNKNTEVGFSFPFGFPFQLTSKGCPKIRHTHGHPTPNNGCFPCGFPLKERGFHQMSHTRGDL